MTENNTSKICSLFNEVRAHTLNLTTNIPKILKQVKKDIENEFTK